jgi:hypothetical protein
MSQFVLLTGDCQALDGQLDVQVKPVQPDQPFLVRAAHELFPTASGACWTVVATETGVSDTLFTEAQAHMLANGCFEATRLARTLMYLVECAQSVVLWYGDDWQDLPFAEDATEFLEHVKYQVLQPSCEVYLRFEKKK